jgi:hypothetical protein
MQPVVRRPIFWISAVVVLVIGTVVFLALYSGGDGGGNGY